MTGQVRLHPFDVTVRIFDPQRGTVIGEQVLPVDSPDAEHAAASTMANAVSFTSKTRDGAPLPVAFQVMRIARRGG